MAKRRPSGDGMVRKRDDGRWEGRIVVGHKENGDSIFHYVSAKTQKALMEKMHRCIVEYDGAELTGDSRMTLGEWLDIWLKECAEPSVRPSTYKGYRGYAERNIKPSLGSKQISKVTAADVQTLYRKLQREGGVDGGALSPTTVRRIHGVLHQALNAAVDRHLIVKNPTDDVTLPKKVTAAKTIDRGIAKAEISRQKAEAASEAQRFEPYTPPRRRPGTGYIKQLKEDLWEGRYSPVWPDGKKYSRNVYGRTREECEEKLAKLILQMKAEIAVLRNGTAAEYPDGVSPKKKQLAEYLRQHPGVSNKSYIARETGMDRTTVQKYYDEVRAELAAPANT